MGIFSKLFGQKQKIGNDSQIRNVIKTYIIEFPYRGKIELEDLDCDDEYISGKDVYLYLDQETIDGINWSWNSSNMIDFMDDKEVKIKIEDMELSIKENGICHMYVKVYEELTQKDKEYVLDYIKGQISDGWGEGNFDYIYNKNNKELYFYWDFTEKSQDKECIPFSIKFWWYDKDWYIKYID
jgi:hypothetical protein